MLLSNQWMAAPADHTFTWAHDGGVPFASADGSDTDVPGFVIDQTDGDGALHKHVDTIIAGPTGTDPNIGIYLAAVEFAQNPTLDPVFLIAGVLNGDAPVTEEHFEGYVEGAGEWVEDNYGALIGQGGGAVAIPEPSTWMLTAIGGVVLLVVARRRRRATLPRRHDGHHEGARNRRPRDGGDVCLFARLGGMARSSAT
jgi:hypothetical protein